MLQRLIDASVDGIFAFDRDCRFIAWNRAMNRITGLRQEEVLGKRVIDVFPFLREAENQHVVRAPVRARIVVPVQFIPNLVAALQEHMRVFSDSYSNVGWTKGPVH